MSMYHCPECDRMCDDDWNPCTEDPRDKDKVLCSECEEEIE